MTDRHTDYARAILNEDEQGEQSADDPKVIGGFELEEDEDLEEIPDDNEEGDLLDAIDDDEDELDEDDEDLDDDDLVDEDDLDADDLDDEDDI